MAPYQITTAGLFGYTPLVNSAIAAKGNRQTGCVPSEDAVAPRARVSGLPVGIAQNPPWLGCPVLGLTSQLSSGRGRPGPTSAEGRFSSGRYPCASERPSTPRRGSWVEARSFWCAKKRGCAFECGLASVILGGGMADLRRRPHLWHPRVVYSELCTTQGNLTV